MNHKLSKNIISIMLLMAATSLGGCATNDPLSTTSTTPPKDTSPIASATEETKNWQHIDANSFTLSLPMGWKFNKLQGTDSYVGEFVGDDIVLSFDYGFYSNPLAEDNDPDHIVTYETIAGFKAKIVIPKVTGKGTTGVYFGDLGDQRNSLEMSGSNLTESQQKTALNIFRTLTFKTFKNS